MKPLTSLLIILLLIIPLFPLSLLSSLPEAEALDSQTTTVTTGTSLGINTKQGMFYTNDTFWVYVRNTDGAVLTHNLYCKNRTATTWTGVWSLSLGSTASSFVMKYNGTHLAYARSVTGTSYFRMGTISGCSISWIAAEDVIITESGSYSNYLQYLEQDANGVWWVMYVLHNPTLNTQSLKVIKNSEVNGTWGIGDTETLEAFKSAAGFGGVLLADSTTVTAVYTDDALDKVKAKVYAIGNSSFGTAYTLTGTSYAVYTGIVRDDYLKVAWIGLTGTYPNWHWYLNVSRFQVGTGWVDTDLIYDWTGSLPTITPQIQYENSTLDALFWQNKPTTDNIIFKTYDTSWSSISYLLTNDTGLRTIHTEDYLQYDSRWLCYSTFSTPTYSVKCYIDNVTISETIPDVPETNSTIPDLDFDPYMFTAKKFYTISQTATMLTDSIDVMQVKFSDGYNTFVLYYDNSTDTFGTNATGYIILDKYHSTTTKYVSTNNYTIVASYIIKLTEKVRDAQDIDLYSFVNNSVSSTGWTLSATDYFDIYNLGGHVEWASSGNAGRTQGGDTFEMYAYNNSWVAVNQTWYHWVQYHAQFSIRLKENDSIWNGINPQFWQDYAHMGVGDVIYADKGDWQIKATVYAFDAINKTYVIQSQCWLQMEYGDWGTTDRWTVLNATWLDKDGSVVRTDLFTAFIENDPQSQVRLYLDLWFNRINASTVNGGRLTAFYYGMHKNAYLWWGDWTAEVGSHSLTNSSLSQAFLNNYDVDGNIAPAQDLELVKIGLNISRPQTAESGPYQPDWALILQDFVISEFTTVPDQQVRGINTPVRIDTLLPDLPATGFWSPIYDAITKIGEYIVTALSAAAGFVWDQIGARWPWFTNFWDSLGQAVSGFMTLLANTFPYLVNFVTFLGSIVSYLTYPIQILADAWIYVTQAFSWLSGESLNGMIIIMVLIFVFLPILDMLDRGDFISIFNYARAVSRIMVQIFYYAYTIGDFLVSKMIQLIRG